MKNFKLSSFLKVFAFTALILGGCQADMDVKAPDSFVKTTEQSLDNSYIVMYKSQSSSNQKSDLSYREKIELSKNESLQMLRTANIPAENITHVYGGVITGFSAVINNAEQLSALQNDSRVVSIEKDRLIILAPPSGKGPGGGSTSPAQETPWGIARVNGGVTYTGSGVAWILDSGIDLDHPDLNVDVSRSMSFLGGKDATDPNDANGHGTHVAGTIAAIDNAEGVVGVAAGATVISVRVLDRRGSGSLSGVIAGIDYVGANGKSGDVANMSLGGGVSTSLDQAVESAAQSSGVKFALAAGNESDNANNHSPARANGNNVYTISAMDINDNFASFSNYGNPPIDYCAPGVSILSTWKDGGYNTISGTSMATPHAAGVLLLGAPKASGTVKGDPDGNADTIISH